MTRDSSVSFVGMGTKVQCKSYLPGYYPMREFNEDSNNNWSMYYGEKTFSKRQYCKGFLPSVPDVYARYDKDIVKQTMLEHEAIFRNQVCELHRLYRIQRDLMGDIKRKQLHKHMISTERSLSSSPIVSQRPPEDSCKWHVPRFHSSLNFINGKCMQPSLIASQSVGCLKDCEILECRPSKVGRKMLDLQLSADEYIETETKDQCSDENVPESSYLPGNCKVASKSSTKLFLFQGQEIFATPKSQFVCMPKAIIQKPHDQRDNGILSNKLLDCKVNGSEQLPYMIATGQNTSNQKSISQGFQQETLNLASQTHSIFNQAHGPFPCLPMDQNKGYSWKERVIFGLEISERSHDASNYNHHLSPLMASQLHSSFPFRHSPDMGNSWSQSHSVLCREKSSISLNQKPLPLQTCLSSPASLNKSPQPSNPDVGRAMPIRNGFYYGSSSGSKEEPICIGFDCTSYRNCDTAPPECPMSHAMVKSFKTSRYVDVNAEKDANWNMVLSSCSSNGAIPQEGTGAFDAVKKHEDHGDVFPWLRAKPVCKNEAEKPSGDPDSIDLNFCQADTNSWSSEAENGKGSSQIAQNIISASSGCNAIELKKVDIGDCLSTSKNLGMSFSEKPCVAKTDSSSFPAPPSDALLHPHDGGDTKNKAEGLPDINLAPADSDVSALMAAEIVVSEKGAESEAAGFNIDLNSCVTEESPMRPSNPFCNGKNTTEIDLEIPAVPETYQDIILPMEEESPEKVSEKPLASLEYVAEDPLDELVKTAAEAIIAISSTSDCTQVNDSTCFEQEETVANPLQLFVEVAFSCLEDLQIKSTRASRGRKTGGNLKLSSSHGLMDYFEIMTLRLKETDMEEEYLSRPQSLDNPSVIEASGTTLLAGNSSQRGQRKRGRQRRDFQCDILPGLASLARQEVTEDLQTFGGLMRATGQYWQCGPTRRNAATRNGCTRGRWQSVTMGSPTTAIAATSVSMPLEQQLDLEVGLEGGKSLTGWGKMTRRPRRQRCPPSNHPLATLPVGQRCERQSGTVN